MKIRDRIKELRRVKASELLPNPRNWRTHPQPQQDALRGVLAEIGFADASLAYETPEGLMLIDGHLRAELAPDAVVPVLILDVNDDEANKVMATHDPLGELATCNGEKLEGLLHELNVSSPDVSQMLSDLAERHGVIPPSFEPVDEERQNRIDEKAKVHCPECGNEFTP